MSLLKPRYKIEAPDGSGHARWRKITFEQAITIANAEAERRQRTIFVWKRHKRDHELVYRAPAPR